MPSVDISKGAAHVKKINLGIQSRSGITINSDSHYNAFSIKNLLFCTIGLVLTGKLTKTMNYILIIRWLKLFVEF